MKKIIYCADAFLKAALLITVTAMVSNVIWQVATRFLLNDPSSFTEEIARFLLIWLGLLGGCYAYRNNAHIGLDIVSKKLTGKTKTFISFTSLAVVALFSVIVLMYGGGKLVLLTLSLKQSSSSLGIPMGYIYVVIPISGLLIALYSIDQMTDLKRSTL